MNNDINYDAITLQDCIAMYEILKRTLIIENGHIVRFIDKEENFECTRVRAF